MSETKELVLFVSGISNETPSKYLNKLVDGLSDYCNGTGILFEQTENSVPSQVESKKQISIKISGHDKKIIDIHEVFWADLPPKLSSQSVTHKILRGLSLLWFWISSLPVWRAAIYSKFMFLNLIFSTSLILIWYYSVIVAILIALSNTPKDAAYFAVLEPLIPTLNEIDNYVSWYIFAIATFLVKLFPVNSIIDISYATQCYLLNRENVFYKIRGRANAVLYSHLRDPQYEKITVVGYSFGAVVAIEALANYTGQKGVRFISLGSPLKLISAKSKRVYKAISLVNSNPKIAPWLDFYSDQDWLCTCSPNTLTTNNFRSTKISSTVSLDEKLKGTSHELYFGDWEVLKTIIANT